MMQYHTEKQLLQTRIFKIDPVQPDAKVMREAAKLIRMGEVVAFPTETVYGLGADATNDDAVKKIFEAKGRPSDNPLIVHVSDVKQLKMIVMNPDKKQLQLIEYYWPGPLTIIFRKTEVISELVTAGLKTVAVRMPSHPVALELIRRSGVPIAAPSANLSGRPSPTKAEHVFQDLNGRIPLILDAGPTEFGVESTVLDLSGERPIILRPGPITAEDLAPLIGIAELHSPKEGERPLSPGMKYRHYAPKVPLILVCSGANGMYSRVMQAAMQERRDGKKVGILCTEETKSKYPDEYVRISLGSRFAPFIMLRNLYDALRRFDQFGVDCIIAEGYSGNGVFVTLMNRLKKAASKLIEYTS